MEKKETKKKKEVYDNNFYFLGKKYDIVYMRRGEIFVIKKQRWF